MLTDSKFFILRFLLFLKGGETDQFKGNFVTDFEFTDSLCL